MKNKIDDNTKQLLDTCFSELEDKDVRIPSYMKGAFRFRGKKSPIIAQKIVSKLTNRDSKVLDPFFGSGSFILGTRFAGRRITGVELDNYTYGIVQCLFKKIDNKKLNVLFDIVKNDTKDKVMSLYETRTKDGAINYIKKLHFDPADKEYYHPHNHRDIRNGQNIVLLFPDTKGNKYKAFDDFDMKKIKECDKLDTSKFPHHKFIENSRINITASTGADRYDTNFTNRAKYALLTIQEAINKIEPSDERDVLEFALVSSIALSKIAMYGDGTDTLYHVVIHSGQERNVWDLFNDKVEAFKKYKEHIANLLQFGFTENDAIHLVRDDFYHYLTNSDEMFDCIYTDPPYSDQVPYLEESQYFRDWLRCFYDGNLYKLTDEMLQQEIVVSNAPSRTNKSYSDYIKDIDRMFEVFGLHTKDGGYVVLTVKLGNAKYFNLLTNFIVFARKHGFELAGRYSIENDDPTIKKQAAYLSVIASQIVIVFKKLPESERYWFIGNKNFENEIAKMTYNEIKKSSNKYVDLTAMLQVIKNRAASEFSIILNDSDLQKSSKIINDNFSVINHTIHLDSNELYLGLEDDSTLFIKLYDIIPVLIRKLLKQKESFTIDDLYGEIAFILFDESETNLFELLNKNSKYKTQINSLIDNYCEVVEDRYVKKQVRNIQEEGSVDISTLEGYEFEQLMTDTLKAYGFLDVVRTGKSGDRGVDLIATQKLPNGKKQKVIFQCKRWIANVDSTPIQRLHSMMQLDTRTIKRAICITTSGYTREAIEVANLTHVELIDGRKLLQILRDKFGNRFYHGGFELTQPNS